MTCVQVNFLEQKRKAYVKFTCDGNINACNRYNIERLSGREK